MLMTYFAKKYIPYHVLHYSAIQNITREQSKEFSEILYEELINMLVTKSTNFILDRSWIGENVYAPMYRNTPGDWVFNIETRFKSLYPSTWKNLYLITFIDSVDNLISREDGESFSIDVNKKNEEIERFVQSTFQSNINNKIIINIEGKDENIIHNKVINFLNLEV